MIDQYIQRCGRRLARSPLLDFASGEDKDRLLSSIPAPEEKDYLPLYQAVGALSGLMYLEVFPQCGARLQPACPTCDRPIEADWRVCPRCATPLDGVQSDATPPLRREVNDEKPPRPEITMGSQRLD